MRKPSLASLAVLAIFLLPCPPGVLAAPAPRQNVRVNDPGLDQLGHTNSGSSVAAKAGRILVGFRDASRNEAAYAFSTDGGASFSHRRVPPPPGGTGLGDPVVALGPAGEAYYAMRTLADGAQVTGIGVAKSTDGGVTFGAPVSASSGVEDGFSSQDGPWLAVDASETSPRKGYVYVGWTYLADDGTSAILLTRSTDGGRTYDFPVQLSRLDFAGVQNTVLAVAPNGDLYVAFNDGHVSPDSVTLLKSSNGGLNFLAQTLFALTPLGTLTGGGGVRASSAPAMAVDGKGTLHIALAVPSGGDLDRSDVYYLRSTDGGGSFGTARKLNDDGTNTTQAFPSLAAAADGTVAVTWADRRNDPTNDAMTDIYMAISRDGGVTFGKNFRVTDHNWVYGPIERGLPSGYHGDHHGLATDGTNFYLTWADERSGDPDVYFAYTPLTFDGGAPDFGISARQVYGTVRAGASIPIDLATSAVNGLNGSLALSTGPATPGLTLTLSTSSVVAGQPARLVATASPTLAVGRYLLNITATAAGLSRTTTVTITVYDPERIPAPPLNVTATPGFTAGGGVKADPAGNLHLAFEDDSAAVLGNDVFYRRSTDGGATFSAPAKLNATDSFGVDSFLAVDGAGHVLAVWAGQGTTDNSNRVFVARSTNGGASFSTPVAVSPSSEVARLPTVALGPGGATLLAYYDVSTFVPTLKAARSTDNGATFTAPGAIQDGSVAALTRPGLAIDSKGIGYLVYTRQVQLASGTASSVFMAKAAAGQAFGVPAMVSNASIADGLGPDTAVGPGDSVNVTFYNRLVAASGEVNREVVFVRSTDGGATFSSQAGVSRNSGQSYFPSVVVEPGGAIDIVWEDSFANDQTDVFISRSTDNGASFSTPVNVSANPGLSGSAANAFEAVGGSGRAAVTAGAGGSLLVSWTDDSGANPDVLLSNLRAAQLSNSPPTVAITNPGPTFTAEAGVPVAFTAAASDPDGDAIAFAWTFGDSTTSSLPAPEPHAFARPGAYVVTLTVTDARGASATVNLMITIAPPTVAGTALLIPVVLDAPGVGGSHHSTEITLASRETSPTDVLLTYTASQGGGTGFARLTLSPGEQRILPRIIDYLRSRNLGIAADGPGGAFGTLLVTFGNARSTSTVFAGARTFTANPSGGGGTFGLFYAAAQTTTTSATVIGLQQNDAQRSNLALVNAGADPITLRIALRGPNGEDLGPLPDQTLGAYGFTQLNQPLRDEAASGSASVTRVSGASPFTIYGVLNDASTSDGSFLPPIVGGDPSSADRLIPVVIDAQGIGARFRSELTLANLSSSPMPLALVYRAADGFGSGSGSASVTLAAGEQRIIPDAIGFLRTSLPIEADGRNVGGSLRILAPAGTPAASLAAGARTFVPTTPSGTFGLFYPGLTLAESADFTAYVFGLQENAAQRSNVAVVNRGDAGDEITLRITYYDASGVTLAAPSEFQLAPGQWLQFGRPLAARGASAGYARIERLSGASRFVAYGVLNDNATSDGSYVPMSR